jgi:hypothetical protein
MIFDMKKFKFTSVSASLILAGVVIRNTYKQLGQTQSPIMYLGPALFVCGWAALAYSLSMTPGGRIVFTDKRTIIFFACAAGIVTSVMLMNKHINEAKVPPIYLPIIFGACWLLLGYSMTNNTIGLAAAGLVIVSMLIVLPWQRKNNVVDGPGMSLFTIALSMIVYAASHSGSVQNIPRPAFLNV